MSKNEYGHPDERKTKSYTSPENNRQADIESEIDKILAEARQEKKAQQDFFAEEHLSSEEKSAHLPKYREEKSVETQVRKPHRESSHSTRETGHREKSKSQRDRNSHTTSKAKKQPKKKSKGMTVIVIVAILAVLTAVGVGAYTYLSGNTSPILEESVKGNIETSTTTLPIHETLVVVTVSGTEISYNGEVLTSTDQLESRLNNEESLTLSLINNDADAETYNAVATVLNKFGGSYELMNKKNTNPSIDTGTSATTTPAPSDEDNSESTTASASQS
ncbi:MAG: hypothetical protein ACI4RI_00400 [Ruminococcus sp.]